MKRRRAFVLTNDNGNIPTDIVTKNDCKHTSLVLVTDFLWKYGHVKARNRSTFSVKSAVIEKSHKAKDIDTLMFSLSLLISPKK